MSNLSLPHTVPQRLLHFGLNPMYLGPMVMAHLSHKIQWGVCCFDIRRVKMGGASTFIIECQIWPICMVYFDFLGWVHKTFLS